MRPGHLRFYLGMEEPVTSSDEEQENDDACIFCNDLYSNSEDREGWIQCNRCRGWAHEACSSAEESEVIHLSDSDYCSCGGIGTALHYATECIYTVFWHMRKPASNFEQEWLKRVANNLISSHKIRGINEFISENRDLFRPP
ncbi:hypothetical protein AVEN_122069-1 [Araneus ventricosus]|uniref:Zinc finger PHD-type domain-containing protein n=1 Tax=Araneus ventricosus TaxID=182803 RepID=A0A4Y2LYQ3_ARAVE|nr:hypothetical protein AVEN_122069-1 [Araneus ventricosus]